MSDLVATAAAGLSYCHALKYGTSLPTPLATVIAIAVAANSYTAVVSLFKNRMSHCIKSMYMYVLSSFIIQVYICHVYLL